jgi:thioredoxin-dependent peroxiredoxin
MTVTTGDLAPNFRLLDESQNWHNLTDYRGKPVVLYFYPKDDTPGCTKEACGFRDDYSIYQERDVVILGISPDSPKSHRKFKEKYQIPFTLLSDSDHHVGELYGSWGKKKFMGREFDGMLRMTFLIKTDGTILRIFGNVKPAEHSKEILSYLD